MPYKPIERICQWCNTKFMGEPMSKMCSRTCATRSVNSRRTYATAENHYNFKHYGKKRHKKEYSAWLNMKNRCGNQKCEHYSDYGGRGISICDSWKNDFNVFLSDVGFAPSKLHSLERVDNSGNYEPSNVIWATKAVQMANRRNNRWIEYAGQKMIMADWAKFFCIEPTNLLKMIKKYDFEHIYNYYQEQADHGLP